MDITATTFHAAIYGLPSLAAQRLVAPLLRLLVGACIGIAAPGFLPVRATSLGT